MDDGIPSAAATVPSWLAARRARQGSTEDSPESSPQVSPVEVRTPPPLPRAKLQPPPLIITTKPEQDDASNRSGLARWVSTQGLIGIVVSLSLHTVALLSLALILMSGPATHDGFGIFGVNGDDTVAGEDIILDTAMSLDSGESSPLQLMEVGQVIEGIGPGEVLSEAVRPGTGGKGKGEGDSGDGVSMGIGHLKIPGHAQTKGSFSAWADPRDPKPGEDYFIVIQIKLPTKFKKYKGSDLSGNVLGTDKYKQEIRFHANQVFPVEDGSVQFRIRVPGAARLVRDTIKVESKMLHEKQTFEIEF